VLRDDNDLNVIDENKIVNLKSILGSETEKISLQSHFLTFLMEQMKDERGFQEQVQGIARKVSRRTEIRRNHYSTRMFGSESAGQSSTVSLGSLDDFRGQSLQSMVTHCQPPTLQIKKFLPTGSSRCLSREFEHFDDDNLDLPERTEFAQKISIIVHAPSEISDVFMTRRNNLLRRGSSDLFSASASAEREFISPELSESLETSRFSESRYLPARQLSETWDPARHSESRNLCARYPSENWDARHSETRDLSETRENQTSETSALHTQNSETWDIPTRQNARTIWEDPSLVEVMEAFGDSNEHWNAEANTELQDDPVLWCLSAEARDRLDKPQKVVEMLHDLQRCINLIDRYIPEITSEMQRLSRDSREVYMTNVIQELLKRAAQNNLSGRILNDFSGVDYDLETQELYSSSDIEKMVELMAWTRNNITASCVTDENDAKMASLGAREVQQSLKGVLRLQLLSNHDSPATRPRRGPVFGAYE